MRIRRLEPGDWSEWLRMSLALYSPAPATELEAGMREFAAMSNATVFVAERDDGSVCGFVEVGTRGYADGCESSPVGYIEAWYVDPDVRRRGIGRALFQAAEAWARDAGYSEMGSDALLDNSVSHQAHMAIGYEEVGRIVQFRKPL